MSCGAVVVVVVNGMVDALDLIFMHARDGT